MNCPYCCEEVSERALVCKVCRRDLHLVGRLKARILELEASLEEARLGFDAEVTAKDQSSSKSSTTWVSEVGIPVLLSETFVIVLQRLALLYQTQSLGFVFAGLATLPSIFLGIWLGLRRRLTWRMALLLAALIFSVTVIYTGGQDWFRTLDFFAPAAKETELAPLGMPYSLAVSSLLDLIRNPYAWFSLFLPPAALFLASFWLGIRLSSPPASEMSRDERFAGKLLKKGGMEEQQTFDLRVKRLSSLLSAVAPFLTLLGTLVASILAYLHK
jgi:hypothetical protein